VLFRSRHYERPFNPDLGGNIDNVLFEPISTLTASILENEIRSIINNYETRVSLISVDVSVQPDKNAYNVSLSFYIQNATLPTTVTLLLERNR
jgi:hypothetical protein